MSPLENKQMLERERIAADKARVALGEVSEIDLLRESAFSALREAERKMHAYAKELEVGQERINAFEVFENIRNAARVG